MRRALLCLLLSAGATLACAPSDGGAIGLSTSWARRAVTDGTAATPAQIGSTVALFELSYGESVCTGTLIAPRVVVSAAHCVRWQGQTTSVNELVIAPSTLQPTAAVSVAVTGVYPHPAFLEEYVPNGDPDGLGDEHDLSVIILAAAVTTAAPTPVLPWSLVDLALQEDVPLTIAGFGLTSEGDDAAYGVLHVAETPYVRRSDSELLAGSPGNPDTCVGDSGGPAYVTYGGVRYLAGATSRGKESGTGACGEGGIYTLVSAFDGWIEEVSGGLYTRPAADDDEEEEAGDESGEEHVDAGGGSCAGQCGGADLKEGCACDPACEQLGDCCADFQDLCPDLAEWSCDDDAFGDGVCDCGCGATDVDCGALSTGSCERSACGDDEVPSADLARCEPDDEERADEPPSDEGPGRAPDPAPATTTGTQTRGPRPVSPGGCHAAGEATSGLWGAALLGLLVGQRARRARGSWRRRTS